MFYEQPLNECTRLCLRLEYLFAHLNHYLEKADDHQAIRTLLEILQTIERHDLKNKLLQNLIQYRQALGQLASYETIDHTKLNRIISEIDKLVSSLHSKQKKIGQELRENEFLNALQQRLHIPAGTCGFNLPAYQLWLAQQPTVKNTQLLGWISQLNPLEQIIRLLLRLTRESGSFKAVSTQNGFYQCSLDSNLTYHLARIELEAEHSLFPEISVGRYRLVIHFFQLEPTGNSKPNATDINFRLACCKI